MPEDAPVTTATGADELGDILAENKLPMRRAGNYSQGQIFDPLRTSRYLALGIGLLLWHSNIDLAVIFADDNCWPWWRYLFGKC